MNMKKWLCLVLAMLLTLSGAALAEGAEDLQAQLDAANARIAELEAEVEKYLPYYESQIVAEFGEDGIVWLADAKAQYDEAAQMYAQYGISVDAYADQIKQSILESLVREGVVKAQSAALGLDQLDEATLADLADQAAADFENYVSYYTSYFAPDAASEEEARETTIQNLASAGITQEVLQENRVSEYVDEQLHDYVTKDVAVTDEDIQAEYEQMVADDEESFADNDFTYNSARSDGAAIAWNPEGYRAVKHVLVKFDDDQSTQYDDLQDALSSLQSELDALDEAESGDAEADEEPAAEADEAEADETPRTREEIQTDMGAVGTSIEALYSELMPRAQEVIDAFNGGADFDELIAQYGEDPGMTREPSASEGYAVSENSTYWESAFTEGAMSIAEVGQISGPVYGSNGIHIIYYMSDIPAGPVAFEEIKDDVEAEALEEKITTTYEDQVSAWIEEANVVYHLDRF